MEDEDVEVPVDETEMFDTLKIEGVLTGEEWLTSQFLLSNNEAMAQTATISKKMEEDNKEKLNKSDISKNHRPISPFGTGPGDNPFSISKMGYANPANLDRSLPSAMKTRNKIPRTPDGMISENQEWKTNFVPAQPYSLEEYIQRSGMSKDGHVMDMGGQNNNNGYLNMHQVGQVQGFELPSNHADRLAELHY